MTTEELARCDGREGRKAYIAVNGTVYDVTTSKLWLDGNHMQQHQAGCDLTEALRDAPHVRAVVERFPAVGRIEAPAATTQKGGGLLIPAVVIGGLVVVVIAILLLR